MSVFAFGVLLLAHQVISASTDCKQEIKDYVLCLTHGDGLRLRKEALEKTKHAVYECFTSNGCKKPSLEHDGDVQKLTDQDKAKLKKVIECLKESGSEIKAKVESCIQADFHGFSFKKLPTQLTLHHEVTKTFLHGVLKVALALHIPGICPTESVDKVKQCLASVSEKLKAARQERLKSLVDKRQGCAAKLSEDCKGKWKHAHEVVTKCACGKHDFSAFKSGLAQCIGSPSAKIETVASLVERIQEKYCLRSEAVAKFIFA